MDVLQAMRMFSRVVEMNSFSRAADSLDLPHTSATRMVNSLESHLHVRLLQRTTRRLSLTPEGAEYYERCVRILAEIDETESALANSGQGPRGRLRIDMPGSIGKLVVMPMIHEFRETYPGIELMVGFGDKPVDLIQDGVDCVIRVGTLEDSSLVARRLSVMQTVTVASPEYLHQYGLPRTLEDLDRHVAVNYFSSRTGKSMSMNFVVDKQPIEKVIPGVIAVNDAEAYLNCAVEGVGLVQTPHFMALPFLQTGALVEVLPQWKPLPMPISAVYPHNRHLAPKVRVFVDWAAELFSHCPLLSGSDDAEGRCRPTAKHLRSSGRRSTLTETSSDELVV